MATTQSRPLEQLQARRHDPFREDELDGSAGRRIARMMKQHGARVALDHDGHQTTYARLDLRAGDLMRRIAERESQAERTAAVGLLTEDPILRIVGMVAAQKLGRPFLPLDPAAPAGRLQLMLRDSQSTALIVDPGEKFESVVASFSGHALFESPDPQPQRTAERFASAGSTSHILYTSGSTGQPKSIAQTHAMVMHKMAEYTSSLRITREDRLSLVASPGFAESWNAVFMALLNGATLCIREVKHHGIEGLAAWMRDSEVTMFHCVPTLLRAIVVGLPRGVQTPALRLLNMGGETVSRADLETCWSRLNPDCVIVNSFGTTETKLIAHYFVDRETEILSETIPVGRPIPDTEVRIVGADGEPVPDGDVGEIEVCSRFIASQYERGTALDQNRFSTVEGDGELIRYCTGDVGRFNADGLLEHLGRHDGIVKLRGYRVELAEVESTLQTHPEVAQATVLLHAPSPQTRQLVATYISEGAPSTDALRRHLSNALPDYMIPSRWVQVEGFPLNVNGKVDRRALLDRVQSQLAGDGKRSSNGEADAAALSPTLRTLLGHVRGVLEIERVSAEDGFVELGGDSLSATELLILLERDFGAGITRGMLFDARSLGELAGQIDAAQAAARSSSGG